VDVAILFGSESDRETVRKTTDILDRFSVSYEMFVTSAHRSPARTLRLIAEAEKKGVKIFIAAAGLSAHLAGVVASRTDRPVIGIPVESGPLKGMDALLSTVQMPKGVPVATMAIGSHGAVNAGLTAVRILSLSDSALAERHRAYIKEMEEKTGA